MKTITLKSDAEIQGDVVNELRWDPRVDEAYIAVKVSEGIVTLTGTTTSLAKRQAAQDAAHRVVGVRDVVNDMTVKLSGGAARTDTQVARAVRQALKWDAMVPDDRIEVTVSDGQVTLSGEVGRWTEREDAERAVRHITGVKRIVNLITLEASAISEQQVRRAIEGALDRRAEREAKRIDVDVAGSTVTLSGTVSSWHEWQAVMNSARYTAGVKDVIDRLRIKPDA